MSRDIELVNGSTPAPAVAGIHIDFDAQTQTVNLTLNPLEFRTWDFVLGILEMAKLKAQQMRQEALMNQMMQQQAQAQQANHLLRRLR